MGDGVSENGIIVFSVFDPVSSGFLHTFGVMLRYGSGVGVLFGLNLLVFYLMMSNGNCDCLMVDNLWRCVMYRSHNCMMGCCRMGNNNLIVMNGSWVVFSGGMMFSAFGGGDVVGFWLGCKTFQMRHWVLVMLDVRFQVFADD